MQSSIKTLNRRRRSHRGRPPTPYTLSPINDIIHALKDQIKCVRLFSLEVVSVSMLKKEASSTSTSMNRCRSGSAVGKQRMPHFVDWSDDDIVEEKKKTHYRRVLYYLVLNSTSMLRVFLWEQTVPRISLFRRGPDPIIYFMEIKRRLINKTWFRLHQCLQLINASLNSSYSPLTTAMIMMMG